MRANRRIAIVTRNTLGALPLCLFAVACGGSTDYPRPTGDSYEIPRGTSLEGCAAEAALAKYDLIAEGDFRLWSHSTDSSPKPLNSVRPIYDCPKDSSYDCCFYDGMSDAWPSERSDLDASKLAQIAEEKELQKSYKCVAQPFVPETTNTASSLFGSMDPDPVDVPIACKKAESPARALHIRVARLSDWGAEIYYEPNNKDKDGRVVPIDATAYDGIAFWVRKGKGGTQLVGNTLFFAVTDKLTKENQDKHELVTDPNTGLPVFTPNANGDGVLQFVIDPTTGEEKKVLAADGSPALNCYDVPTDAEKCDRFGHGVGLEDEWRFVKIPFKDMRQRGFGVKSPAGRPLYEEIFAINFYMDIGSWDFWISNVGFYKDSADTAR